MAVATWEYQFFDSGSDTLTPAAGVKIKITSLICSVGQQGASWTMDDGTDGVQLTPSDSSNTQGAGIAMAFNNAWGGPVTVGGMGMLPIIMDENMSLNQNKSMDAGQASYAAWIVLEE